MATKNQNTATEVVKVSTKIGEGEEAREVKAETVMSVAPTLGELAAIYGDEQVRLHAIRGLRLNIQAKVRQLLTQGLSQDDIVKETENWRPEDGAGIKNPRAAIMARFGELSDEEQEAMLSELRAKKAAQPA